MLIEKNSYLYAYSITRDFGFAPNPFHGVCTLATCKPRIRKAANIGDWILGIGGANLKSVKKKCILLMKVTEKISFNDYWEDNRFAIKKPARNGSHVQILGDNIYHQDDNNDWIQEDSHHSNADGSFNMTNLERDTRTDKVLISRHFYYFGDKAVDVDLDSIGYHRIRDYLKLSLDHSIPANDLIKKIEAEFHSDKNIVISDPCQFSDFYKRVDQGTGELY
ncbi:MULTISPECIES: hypothetical protein [Enterobacteriaceae]|uniref:Nmad2 family putative nucleotide modification protein n=1 Tax=Enterobacteriaceae TaxID=543 RepID=UPI0005E80433|nr:MULTISPECIES: hypothetical protein [Enterobacteriaceae]ELY2743089.1 hypothetical protein [Cronobacter turicensis]EFI1493884.1 hypothetical protein [Escherichia coli]EIM3109503.1 hypothetical protein [Escherichia coli]KAE9667625.1 hypothetical protein GP723_05235 [Escherichia coli]KAE9671192.1 hypothetical protein GP722_12310 [Escherichia coli]